MMKKKNKTRSLKTATCKAKMKVNLWIYATSPLLPLTSERLGFTPQSDWLAEGKRRPDDKRDGKWTWSGSDMMSANAPIDQHHWHPSQNPARWVWSTLAAEGYSSLSQHCPITLHIITSRNPLPFRAWWTDDNHRRFIVSLRLLISRLHVCRRFCSHLYLKKVSNCIVGEKVSRYNISSIKTFTNLMKINDCSLFFHRCQFSLFGSGIAQSGWFIAWSRSGKVFVPVANELFVFMMRVEDGKVI